MASPRFGHLMTALLVVAVTFATLTAAALPLRGLAMRAEPPEVLVAVFPPWQSGAQANRAIVQAGGIPVQRLLGGMVWTFIATDASHPRNVERQGALVLTTPGENGPLVGCSASLP